MSQVALDDENRCILIEEVGGITSAHDITQGRRMGAKSGYTVLDGREMVISKCGCCGKEHANTGDKATLRIRNGPEGAAVYWCMACYKVDFAREN